MLSRISPPDLPCFGNYALLIISISILYLGLLTNLQSLAGSSSCKNSRPFRMRRAVTPWRRRSGSNMESAKEHALSLFAISAIAQRRARRRGEGLRGPGRQRRISHLAAAPATSGAEAVRSGFCAPPEYAAERCGSRGDY